MRAPNSVPIEPVVLRLAFLGFWQVHRRCSWNDEVSPHADLVLPSRAIRGAKRFLRRATACLGEQVPIEIRLAGYSWGALTAGHVANALLAGTIVQAPDRLRVRLALLDPVDTLRRRLVLPADEPRLTAWCAYQRNGCYRGCPGWSGLYRGIAVPGASNLDLTRFGRNAPPADHVPPDRAPDHLQLGYRGWGGWGARLATVLTGGEPWPADAPPGSSASRIPSPR